MFSKIFNEVVFFLNILVVGAIVFFCVLAATGGL
jgi:hypothetical protein